MLQEKFSRLDVCNCSYYFKCAHFNKFFFWCAVNRQVSKAKEHKVKKKRKFSKWILNEFDKIFSKSDKLHPPVSRCYNCENFSFLLFSISSRIQHRYTVHSIRQWWRELILRVASFSFQLCEHAYSLLYITNYSKGIREFNLWWCFLNWIGFMRHYNPRWARG